MGVGLDLPPTFIFFRPPSKAFIFLWIYIYPPFELCIIHENKGFDMTYLDRIVKDLIDETLNNAAVLRSDVRVFLSDNTANMLNKFGIHTVYDLICEGRYTFKRRGFGAVKQKEVVDFLRREGLSLGMTFPDDFIREHIV